ncbi:tetratricopeptide repeat protein [Thalassoglobus neptunius]|uniref:Tetratricopeptide repeat protein n=1 Tax=Thalassoglobus neptunius TaxID=1938619 RepID=A0A5C5WIG9_9PLAN|nr:tetratricopeptide repeat protein [Thalassoglobus neptunius]TWT49801.1 tetratricopeptide repeat protein [Thalassoglobus neptunius]
MAARYSSFTNQWVRWSSAPALFLVSWAMSIGSLQLSADDQGPPPPELPQRINPLEGIIDPVTGEELSAFEPKTPETNEEELSSEALALYMTGRIALERRDFDSAVDSFRKAIELAPNVSDSYKTLIPLLLAQREHDEAAQLALQASLRTDSGYELVAAMAGQFASRSQLDKGIDLIKEALDQADYPAGSLQHLLLHRDLGLYYRLNNQIENAASEYEIVLNTILSGEVDEELQQEVLKDPGKNFDEFGDTFLKAGLPDLALKAFEEASKHREAKPGLHSFNLATVFYETGKPEQALEALQEYFDAQLQGRGRAAYELLEKILKELGREDELNDRLNEMYANDEFNDVLRFFLADRVLESQDLDRAKELYLGSNPDVTDPRAMVGLLQIYREEGDSDNLLDILTKAFQVIPRAEDPAALNRLSEDVQRLSKGFEEELEALKSDEESLNGVYASARKSADGDDPQLQFIQAYFLGKMATETENTEAAIEFYRLAISMRNDPPPLLYSELGGYLIDSKSYEEAIDLLNEALTNPSDALQNERWRFLYFLTYAYQFDGQTERALEAVDEAMNNAPDPIMGRLLYQKAWIYYHNRDWDQALKYFNQVLSQYASETDLVQDTQFRVSNIYVEQGDMEQGEQVLLDVLQADPENTQANNDLGYLWADQGKNLEKAREMIQIALTAEPENPAYLDSMGWVLYQLGEYEEAAKILKSATEQKHGDDSTIFDHLGDAQLKLGQEDEAKENFERALKIEEEKEHPSEKLLKALRSKLQIEDKSTE